MKRVIAIGIIFFMLSIVLVGTAGCTQNSNASSKIVSLTEASKKSRPIELYVKQDITLGKYEPLKGTYLGAYVDKNHDIQTDITVYEELLQQPQTFKVFQYTMGQGLPSEEILKCIAQKKVPYVKILLGSNFDLAPLYRLVSDIRESYSTPIFIELFPLTNSLSQPMAYKELYKNAYDIVHRYLKNAVVVWSVDDTRIYDMLLYYPGDDQVDWVGLNLYIPKYRDNSKYNFTQLGAIDYWYKSFQRTKPMMFSSLAVSHFSRVDHTYSVQDAKDKLNLFYNDMLELYPRIKAVLYIDVDMGQVVRNGKEDYRITSQKELIDYMKQIFKKDVFLDEIQEMADSSEPKAFMKYDVEAAQFGEEIYISKICMNTLFKKVPLSKITMLEDLNGEKYYKLDDIKQFVDLYYRSEKQ